jgi:hypothetical protein
VLPNALQILQNVIVPKAQDSVAARLQPFRSSAVAYLSAKFGVLPSVDFDHELGAWTEEVDNIRTNRLLPAERDAELVFPENIPKSPLGYCRRVPQ